MTTWQQTIYTIVLVAVISGCLSVVVSYGPGTLQAFRADVGRRDDCADVRLHRMERCH
jgi:hypothetical protein